MDVLRTPGVLGEVVVRTRGRPAVVELIVNGAFVMDTAETSTETLLAESALEQHPNPSRVLVGGLGLGLTAAAVVADRRVRDVVVAEIEPELVRLLHGGGLARLVPSSAVVSSDARCRLVVGDVVDVARQTSGWDIVLLDVDNGPGFLIHDRNAALYTPETLGTVANGLNDDGMLAVWSSDAHPPLHTALAEVVGPTHEVHRTVMRQGREIDYVIYLARRASERTSQPQ